MSNTPSEAFMERCTTLDNLVVVVDARPRSMFLAWFLDTLVMWAAVAGLVVATVGTSEPASVVVLAVMTPPLAAFVYGLSTAHRRSLGQLAAGTRTVRFADGTAPGFWRAGWVMLVRMVIMPLFVVVNILTVLDGGVDEGKVRHVSIDDRETQELWRTQPRLAGAWLDWPGSLA